MRVQNISNVFINSHRTFICDIRWLYMIPRVLHSLKVASQNKKNSRVSWVLWSGWYSYLWNGNEEDVIWFFWKIGKMWMIEMDLDIFSPKNHTYQNVWFSKDQLKLILSIIKPNKLFKNIAQTRSNAQFTKSQLPQFFFNETIQNWDQEILSINFSFSMATLPPISFAHHISFCIWEISIIARATFLIL